MGKTQSHSRLFNLPPVVKLRKPSVRTIKREHFPMAPKATISLLAPIQRTSK